MKNIIQNKSNETIVVHYMNQKWLDEIRIKSGKLAEDNEYQCHYFALVRVEEFDDNSILRIVIPVLFYNYPQKVSTASIDFNMEEVEELAKNLLPLAQRKANTLLNRLLSFTDSLYSQQYEIPKNIKYELSIYNNIHKHP